MYTEVVELPESEKKVFLMYSSDPKIVEDTPNYVNNLEKNKVLMDSNLPPVTDSKLVKNII